MSERIALVTGASSGIGEATARILLESGWRVVGLSRGGAAFDSDRYRDLRVDLSDLNALTRLAEEEIAPILDARSWNRVGLVNNAATGGALRVVEEQGPEHLARVYALNVVAPTWLMGFVVRATSPGTALRIVDLSSGAARQAMPGMADYCGSKAALRMAGRVLAAELASEERPGGPRPDAAVLSYEPGVVDTPMQEQARSAESPWSRMFVEFHESGMLEPPEAPAAEIVEFLSGDASETFVERHFGEG